MKTKNTLLGLFFILAGVGITINHFVGFVDINIFHLVITVMLIPIIVVSIKKVQFGGIFFPLAILGILYEHQLGIKDFIPWPILIVATLLTIGFSIIFNKHSQFIGVGVFNEDEEIIDEEDENFVNVSVKMGSTVKYVNSEDFKRGKFNCAFGGLSVYFDNTKLNENGARINLDASFAGVQLFIPKNWEVVLSLNSNFGGCDENNKNNPDGKNKLIITGNINFAGVDITYI